MPCTRACDHLAGPHTLTSLTREEARLADREGVSSRQQVGLGPAPGGPSPCPGQLSISLRCEARMAQTPARSLCVPEVPQRRLRVPGSVRDGRPSLRTRPRSAACGHLGALCHASEGPSWDGSLPSRQALVQDQDRYPCWVNEPVTYGRSAHASRPPGASQLAARTRYPYTYEHPCICVAG
jgi:hypothetical protein